MTESSLHGILKNNTKEVRNVLEKGFVYLDEAVEGVLWDAKYFSADNFTGGRVTGYCANRVVGTVELACALQKVSDAARAQDLRLVLWDAYRPQRAVAHFMRWCAQAEDGRTKEKHYPNVERSEMVKKGYIAARSGHSRGSTIDLTLADEQGDLLDMGGIFDFMDERSHHGCKDITPLQQTNRQLLRQMMLDAGFTDYKNEWWHYRLKNEPYPDTYFDFVIE